MFWVVLTIVALVLIYGCSWLPMEIDTDECAIAYENKGTENLSRLKLLWRGKITADLSFHTAFFREV